MCSPSPGLLPWPAAFLHLSELLPLSILMLSAVSHPLSQDLRISFCPFPGRLTWLWIVVLAVCYCLFHSLLAAPLGACVAAQGMEHT